MDERSDSTQADQTQADQTQADQTLADRTLADLTLGERLRGKIAAIQPATDSPAWSLNPQPYKKSIIAPALTYGRHRGPPRDTSRLAAVVIALFQQPVDIDASSDAHSGQWMIPLTLRPTTLLHHGGQICLPGGQVELGETVCQAALREYEEELGLPPIPITNCGELSTQYVFGSDNRVHPIVVTIKPPKSDWQPDPAEVAEVILLPLSTLLSNSRTTLTKMRRVRQAGKVVDQLTYRAPAIQCGDHAIWGATALILDELAQLLLVD